MPVVQVGLQIVKAFANGRAGINDRTQHPQFYCTYFEYICCIPRSLPQFPFLHWTPTIDDCPLASARAAGIPLRYLKPEFRKVFEDYRIHYSRRCRAWLEDHPENTDLVTLDTHMSRCLSKLINTGMTFKELVFSVAEFQRSCLDVHAYLDFHMVYLKRSMDTVWPVNPNLMGAFTQDFNTAYDLHQRGIPVWYLRPSFRILPDMNVGAHHPFDPVDCILNDFAEGGVIDPYPVLRTCYPGTLLQCCFQRTGLAILDLISPSTVEQDITTLTLENGVTFSIEPSVANARAIGADAVSGGAVEQGSERLREQPYSHSRVRAGDKRWID
ncbi:hypothetical protein NMY22_g19652 [Coprinellus aureogranulatus]|nr:hypothetical protein NMY22_g19652 [Coprinellus aureogranulatus]